MNGNKIATLYYESRPADSLATVKGRIEEFDTGSDILTATPSKTIEVGDIAPNNGKNTIAIDGNYIYVCRSERVSLASTALLARKYGTGQHH